MGISGEQLLAGVQYLTEKQSRLQAERIALTLGEESQSEMERLGLAHRAPELFQLFRSSDLRAPRGFDQNPGNENPAELHFVTTALAWGVPIDDAKELFERFANRYRELRTLLFKSRSLATHVMAVLRPFRAKYIELWKENNIKQIDFGWLQNQTEYLESVTIDNLDQLFEWRQRVYLLFSKCAVIDKETEVRLVGERLSDDHKKPLGMIRGSSEKIYEHQWRSWFQAYGSELMQLDYSTVPPLRQNAVYTTPALSREKWNTAMGAYSRFSYDASTARPKLSTSNELQLKIQLQSNTDSSLQSEWSGVIEDTSTQQIDEWLKDVQLFWGAAAESVAGSLTFGRGETESQHAVPKMTVDKFAELVTKTIERKLG